MPVKPVSFRGKDPVQITAALRRALAPLRFAPPVAQVYNPIDYARASNQIYLERYARKPCDVLLVGMNPGPWGMAQTGVPFGEISMVRDWMGIEAPVKRPANEHPKRPILGFDCTRSEVSGARLWGWARDRFHTPDAFFDRFFVHNHCPLAFMEESGRNLTPDKLPAAERDPLLATCDAALAAMVDWLDPVHVIGVGGFAEKRIHRALGKTDRHVGRIPHPSPASPAANRGWAAAADAAFRDLGIAIP